MLDFISPVAPRSAASITIIAILMILIFLSVIIPNGEFSNNKLFSQMDNALNMRSWQDDLFYRLEVDYVPPNKSRSSVKRAVRISQMFLEVLPG